MQHPHDASGNDVRAHATARSRDAEMDRQIAAAPPMATFVARCLEEIALEGRCGIPVRMLFELVDPTDDTAYRQYAWRVLRSMHEHLSFYHMERAPDGALALPISATTTTTTSTTTERLQQPQQLPPPPQTTEAPSSPLSSPSQSRKRKWSTTLASSPQRGSDSEQQQQQQLELDLQHQETRASNEDGSSTSGQRSSNKPRSSRAAPVVPSARRTALKKQRRLLAGGVDTTRRHDSSSISSRPTSSVKTERRRSVDNSSSPTPRSSISTSTSIQTTIVTSPHQVSAVEQQLTTTTDTDSSSCRPTAAVDAPVTIPPATAPVVPAASSAVAPPESADWVLQSPRGFVRSIQVDASRLPFDDAMIDAAEGVLGVVASESLRLQHLGATDPSALDPLSPQFDLLELIGRARANGENAARLTGSHVFGDARKLHYLLDMLLAAGLVAKRMVMAQHRRFNVLHLPRFTRAFHASMLAPSATLHAPSSAHALPKRFASAVIAELLAARGARTCVFADIGRELGYDKRHQEALRKRFFHEMHVNPTFPLELFMARCSNSASGTEASGRKLWCIRLRHGVGPHSLTSANDRSEPLEPSALTALAPTTGPVLERGLMEQVYSVIASRGPVGATIPEIRDILGVPTFKLPYRLAQGLIAKYNLTVRQVVVGKSTMYRMFVPGGGPDAVATAGGTATATASQDVSSVDSQPLQQQTQQVAVVALGPSSDVVVNSDTIDDTDGARPPQLQATIAVARTTKAASSGAPLPSTMKEAARGALVSSTAERRRAYMLARIEEAKIMPVHQLRSELMLRERDPLLAGNDLNIIDARSVRRILDEFEAVGRVVALDVALPPRRVLQKRDRVVKCVCLAGHERDRDAIRAFVDAYVDEQQQRYVRDLAAPVADDVVVETKRSRGRRQRNASAGAAASAVAETTLSAAAAAPEVVQYNAASYKTTRLNMTKHQAQARRLGMLFGALARCRALHVMLWDKIEILRERATALTTTPTMADGELQTQPPPSTSDGSMDATALSGSSSTTAVASASTNAAVSNKPPTATVPSRRRPRRSDTVFAIHDVLALLSVKEFLQLLGPSELLSEAEENKVRMAMVRGDAWDALSPDVRHKVRGCATERVSRLVRTLVALGLVHVATDASRNLLELFRSRDLDAIVSHVASTTLSGGLLKLKHRARIVVQRSSGDVLTQLPTTQSYVYAAGFASASRSAHLAGRVPLEYDFAGPDDALAYWRALQFLSIDGAFLGAGARDGETLRGAAVRDSERLRAAPLKDHNLYALKSWATRSLVSPSTPTSTTISSSESQRRRSTDDKRKAGETVEPSTRSLKRKRFQSAVVTKSRSATTSQDRKSRKNSVVAVAGAAHSAIASPSAAHTEAGVSQFRRLVQHKQSARAAKWTLADDLVLMDAYVVELSRRWFIDVPLALQQRDEPRAFRHAGLARSKIPWRVLAQTVGTKSFRDCYLRVHELLAAPAVRARVEATKRSVTAATNPSGAFYEQQAIASQPRLAALVTRALQILMHDRARYVPLLADMLISAWTENEVKLVWRYLWLAGLITRTTSRGMEASQAKQRERGFCVHSRVYEMTYLGIAYYALDVFCGAAEYAAFVQANASEAAMLLLQGSSDDRDDDDDPENSSVLEHDVEPNASAGHTAAALSALVLAIAEFVPEYVEPSAARRALVPRSGVSTTTIAAATAGSGSSVDDSRRAVAIKGVAGHLAAVYSGISPDDFLRDVWSVKARVPILSDAAKQDAVATRARTIEAFSTSLPMWSVDTDTDATSDDSSTSTRVDTAVVDALQSPGPDGLSFRELCDALVPESAATVRHALERLVACGDVVQASAFTHARFVLKAASSIWTLHPYRIVTAADDDNDDTDNNDDGAAPPGQVLIRFDKQQTVVARPWQLLDGSTNARAELTLKRKVVNIVMCRPGIRDCALQRQMRDVLPLQTLRALVDELIADDIVHARLVRGAAHAPQSVFARSRRPCVDVRAVAALAPGDACYVDAQRDAVHYFPAVNCMELLGAAACDADVRET